MTKVFRKYWLEIIFSLLIFNEVLCAIGYVRQEIRYRDDKKMNIESKWVDDDFDQYIERLSEMNEYEILISGEEIDFNYFSQNDLMALQSIGFENLENGQFVSTIGFVGIIREGDIIYQELCTNDNIYYSGRLGNHYLFIESNGTDMKNQGNIYIDDIKYSVDTKGINIVVFDEKNEVIVDSVNYCFVNGNTIVRR